MVELSQGDVTEVRRGGPESLRILSTDISRLETTGYIRLERRQKDQMPRVGHIVFKHGKPMMAIYEHQAITMSLEALLDIENDALHVDALLAIHELALADIERILSLHNEAKFQVSHQEDETQNEHQWWSRTRLKPSSWKREERLPELETVIEAPESVRMRSKAMMQRYEGLEKMIRPGDAYLFDSTDPTPMFVLAGHLAVHGRPMLVIARHDIEALNVEHNIPIASCSWLTQSDKPNSIRPLFQEIQRKIDSFLWENLRAVVVIEGIEYLASLHGDEQVVNFLRDIVDGVRLEDHVLFTTADSNAFARTTRERLVRDLRPLDLDVLEHWNLEPDLILDHPLCALPNEEEKQWIEQQLQQAISMTEVPESSLYAASVFGTMEGGVEPPPIHDVIDATNDLGSLVDEWVTSSKPQQIKTEETKPQVLQKQETPSPAEIEPSQEQESTVEQTVVTPTNTETVQIAELEVPSPQLDIVMKASPRQPTRIKRKKKTARTVHRSSHLLRTQAVANHANEVPELSQIPLRPTSPRAAFSTSVSLEEKLMNTSSKTSSSITGAFSNSKVGVVKNALSPTIARDGISSKRTGSQFQRESASREQTDSPLQDTLSIWDLEDIQRLKQQKAGDSQ